MAIDFAGGGVSIELSHFVRISDATFYMGSCLWCFLPLWISRVPRPFVTVLALACVFVFCAYCITATECDFSFVADVVGTGAGSSGTLLRRPLRCTVYGRSRFRNFCDSLFLGAGCMKSMELVFRFGFLMFLFVRYLLVAWDPFRA